MSSSGTCNNPRGAALVIAMLVMAVLLLAGTTFLTISSTEYQIAINEQASARSFDAADMGMQRAMASLAANAAYTGENNVQLAFGLTGSRTVLGTATIGVNNSALAPTTDVLNRACAIKDVVADGSVNVLGGRATTRLQSTIEAVGASPFKWGMYGDYIYVLNYAGTVLDSYDSRTRYGMNGNNGGALTLASSGGVHIWGGTPPANISVYAPLQSSYPQSIITMDTRPNSFSPSMVPAPGQTNGDSTVADGNTLVLPPGTYDSITVGNNATLILQSGSTYFINNKTISCNGYGYSNLSICLGTGAKISLSGDSGSGSHTGSNPPVTVYLSGNVRASDGASIGGLSDSAINNIITNNQSPPDKSQIASNPLYFIMNPSQGSSSFEVYGSITFYGVLYGPQTAFWFEGSSEIFGSITGNSVWVWSAPGQTFLYHFDRSLANLPSQAFCVATFALKKGTWQEVIP